MRQLAGYEKMLRLTREEEGKDINAQITIPLDIAEVRVLIELCKKVRYI